MNAPNAQEVMFLVACSALFYTGFCRLVRVDKTTAFPVRVSIYLLTVSAVVAITSVLFWDYQPQWPGVALAVSIACLQMATSRAWREGVPKAYRREA